jgi:inner membrane protein
MQRAVTFGESYARTNGLMDAKVTALPRPVSPFHWMVIVEEPERYRYAMVSLSRTGPPVLAPGAGFFTRLAAPYLPLSRARWQAVERFGSPDDATFAREAFSHRDFEFFHWFARYPALYRVETGKPSACAWFQDLRFLTPGRATWPFRYGMCRDASGQWRPYELLSDNDTIPVH